MMRKIITSICFLFYSITISAQDSVKITSLQQVGITAVKAPELAPFSKIEMTKHAIKSLNTGIDLPMILQYQVGVQSFSDAGNGVGYTGIRLRGSDITRINVTLNGVPVNDAESQGTFFVNLPDLASSTQNIQIQRGAGSSSNGPGALAGAIHINTIPEFDKERMTVSLDAGSFYTGKLSLTGNTAIKNKWAHAYRLSGLTSEGYIRNSFSRLAGGQYHLAYFKNKNTNLAFHYNAGGERTGQAWNGVSQFLLDSARRFNELGIREDGTYYRKQTDNYTQHYFQLHYNTKQNSWSFNLTPYYTRGLGYYQEYKIDANYADYKIDPIVIGDSSYTKGTLARQLWLNNHLFGIFTTAMKTVNKNTITASLHANHYLGAHYGRVPWIARTETSSPTRWYELDATKTDLSGFVKYQFRPLRSLIIFTDAQLRHVDYHINGFRNNPTLITHYQKLFFNPKAGINYLINDEQNNNSRIYYSIARAQKEPNREDFENNITPKAEELIDQELGFQYRKKNTALSANLYYMFYKNQLILTGKLNDVGAYTRTNVDRSYRAGIELDATHVIGKQWILSAQAALSRNEIPFFTEYIWNEDSMREDAITHKYTSIAFSPNLIASMGVQYRSDLPIQAYSVQLLGKFVSRQYLDNTSSFLRSIPSYYNLDLILNYTPNKFNTRWNYRATIYNITNHLYEANGYTYGFISGGTRQDFNYFYPMAGTRVMVGCTYQLLP